jgi:hypothetical protein
LIDGIGSIPPVDEWFAQMTRAKKQHITITGKPKEKTWFAEPHAGFFRRLARKVRRKSHEPGCVD